MPHKIAFVDNSGGTLAHYKMLAELRHFCGGFGDLGTVTYAGTGDGQLAGVEASPDSVTETWTLTCTAESVGAGTFSVVGSVSGAQAAATVGVAYDNDLVAFTIAAGAIDFEIDDAFEIPVTQGAASAAGAAWEVLRYDDTVANRELILKGRGYTGTEEIFVGFRTYQNADADYYNLLAGAFTGYVPGNPFDNQPGAMLSGVPGHNQRIDYWLTLNPQRIALAMKVGTPVYESAYVGKMLPYGRPGQYPYPLVCGGMLNGAQTVRFSDTSHSGYFRGNRANLQLRTPGGWQQPLAYPWSNPFIAGSGGSDTQTQLRDTGGIYHPLPVELLDGSANLWGALDGIYYITGFDNTVESTFTIAGVDYVCIQDVSRTDHRSFYAMRLD